MRFDGENLYAIEGVEKFVMTVSKQLRFFNDYCPEKC